MKRKPTAAEIAAIEKGLRELDAMRRDPTSDWHRGPAVEREFLRTRERQLLEVKLGERDPDDMPVVTQRDQDLRAFAIVRHERPGFWHSGSADAEALRARERAMLEEEQP